MLTEIIRHDLPDYIAKTIYYEIQNNMVHYYIRRYQLHQIERAPVNPETLGCYTPRVTHYDLTLELPDDFIPEQIPQYISVAINALENAGLLRQILDAVPQSEYYPINGHRTILKTLQEVKQYFQALPDCPVRINFHNIKMVKHLP